MLWKAGQGMDVVDTATAETAGRVSGFVVDGPSQSISAVLVGDRIVSWDRGAVGSDVVTVEHLEDAPKADAKALNPLGKAVFSDDGIALGKVSDIEFDPDSGAILRIVLGDDEVPGHRLLGLGSYAVVVAAEGTTA